MVPPLAVAPHQLLTRGRRDSCGGVGGRWFRLSPWHRTSSSRAGGGTHVEGWEGDGSASRRGTAPAPHARTAGLMRRGGRAMVPPLAVAPHQLLTRGRRDSCGG